MSHQFGLFKDLLVNLEDQDHLELQESKDLRVPQAFQGMQVCQEPQENEV